MTKTEARAWAYLVTAKALRKKAAALIAADVSKTKQLTPTQLEKCRQAMRDLADMLDAKRNRFTGGEHDGAASEGSSRAPGAVPEAETSERAPELPGAGVPMADDSSGGGDR